MKTKTLMTGGWIIVLAALLTSCSTSIDIAKRQFNGGYYVNISKKQPVHSKAITASAHSEASDAQTAADVQSSIEIAIPANEMQAAETQIVAAKPAAKKPSLATSSEVIAQTTGQELETPASAMEYAKADSAESFASPSMKGRPSDLILILLCIFLPFIAVGIVDDWGTRFLISILLCLLFWLPGVIYAFVVCFG